MIDDDFRAELASYAERLTVARRKEWERGAEIERRRAVTGRSMRRVWLAGMPARLAREYEQRYSEREGAE
jgi:hypothetical protein